MLSLPPISLSKCFFSFLFFSLMVKQKQQGFKVSERPRNGGTRQISALALHLCPWPTRVPGPQTCAWASQLCPGLTLVPLASHLCPAHFGGVQEWGDPLRYIMSVKHLIEPYGIAKLCPPDSWRGAAAEQDPMQRKRLLQDLGSFAMPTRIQEISRLQVGRPAPPHWLAAPSLLTSCVELLDTCHSLAIIRASTFLLAA